jgi:sugar/nucleoside kinase (ribokinase family)
VSEQYEVAAIGNAIVDVIHPATDGFLLEHGIAKGVMSLIDEFRAARLIAALPESQVSSGGSAANTMAGLASYGARGHFTGKVRADALGDGFAQDLKRIGVRFDTPKAKDGPATACCVIAVTSDGQRSMSTYLGACREIAPADVDTKAIAAAKSAGRKVAFTLSDPFCVGRYRSEFLELMRDDVDILFANEEEAKALYEVDDFDAALQAARAWHGLAALTRSAKGCVVAAEDGEVHVLDAEPVEKVIDTTGAGDQFAAGFLYGLSRGKDMRSCGRLGGIAAAEVISHYGARPERKLAELERAAGL